MKIKNIKAREILDSRGNPTIETTVFLENNFEGIASVPSGASTGKHEALELRDNDKKRYHGKGVLNAVKNVNERVTSKLIGLDAKNQKKIDRLMIELDGTENKSNLGANAILSVSLAAARAQANAENIPLYQYLSKFNPDFLGQYVMPIPQINIINGGKHANWSSDIQEYMILPIGAKSISEAIRMGTEVYFTLKEILRNDGFQITVGDEGGFAPILSSNEKPLYYIENAIKKTGYIPGKDISMGIDTAASEIYSEKTYFLKSENKQFTDDQLINLYNEIKDNHAVISMEDIFDEDAWDSFKRYTLSVNNKIQIVGDDLYVTNYSRIKRGINDKITNSVLIKLNQIGTLTETIDAILLAKKNNMSTIISHRSGETEDSFIADLAVGMNTGQIKTGAPARSERTTKYNRLMAIEQELKDKASYAKFPYL